MADRIRSSQTTLVSEDVVVRAVQYFSGSKWRPSGQSGRTATFQGMPPVPWGLMFLTIIGLVFCIVPGIVCYIMLFQKARQFQNLIVTASPVAGGSEVVVNYPPFAENVVAEFLKSLPQMPAAIEGDAAISG
jgi:hypothetical protein